jgi:hypothetical protein
MKKLTAYNLGVICRPLAPIVNFIEGSFIAAWWLARAALWVCVMGLFVLWSIDFALGFNTISFTDKFLLALCVLFYFATVGQIVFYIVTGLLFPKAQ